MRNNISDNIDWYETKRNMGSFLRVYKIFLEREGKSYPKIGLEGTLVLVNEKNKFNAATRSQSNLKIQELFIEGFTAIMHPFNPEITKRRRKIFLFRFFYGLSIPLISERVNYQRNVIILDSKVAIYQFCEALNLVCKLF
ncbi:hypothetical protein RV11_GL003185 [Enterococcus phoeniculicola]|uniref:ArpU family phage transcriptional regulator n=1 Tax=Enterococcus phoeniculicola ATCC BAA-412 TaxID=1158610 RepID=R3W5T1_9ENTE|nr:hypothetical protein [Enterococcus phoeniculicola]EOL42996.1 hypothetical protein UC3_01973 [Enterococcus phoeniculicola ATCC BAA-412]EOT76646.1 hypothetical protein I589_01603 [Enterococcus phoeniculicola ATCC BAA-412]OJG72214.1 hypothetical protein RV11_GL003185 [Enterococcus phoeniculicola]